VQLYIEGSELLPFLVSHVFWALQQTSAIDSYNFEVVTDFMYLGTLINCENDLDEQIKRRITIGNRCYYGMSKLVQSQSLKRKTKCQLYKTIVLSTVLCRSESWTLSLAHEHFLEVLRERFQGESMEPGEDDIIRNYIVYLMMLI
jgi:hypothetical protein